MATISYKCNTCKKQVEYVENQFGLTVIGKCSLTDGCAGKLIQTKRNPNNVRQQVEYYNDDLEDFTPRNKFFKFIQTNDSTIWKINHDLNSHPLIVIFKKINSGYVKVDNSDYSISYINGDILTVRFNSAISGMAHCISRSSNNDALNPNSTDQVLIQATTNGTFTFAIPKKLTRFEDTPTVTPAPSLPLDLGNTGDIQIEVGITLPNQDESVCLEIIPNLPTSSPWNGWNEIIIRNRRNYYVKMKNILKFKVFDDSNIKLKDIPDGTKLRFLKIDYGTGVKQIIPSRGCFLLLSNSPFSNIDKNLKQVVDLGEIIKTPYWYFTFKNGEFYFDVEGVETIFPDIRKMA